MNGPTVSVLMTAYNREAYLAEAIESVLASDFNDFELIIVDDCSTDDSLQIAQEFAQQDTRIRVYQNDKNLSDYPNRNKAASYAEGRYLKYVDSDDKIHPDCLSVMVAGMEASPEAALGLCQKAASSDKYPMQLSPHEAYTRSFLSDKEDDGIFGNGPLSTIIRRSAFESVGGFSGSNYIGDGELWLKLGAHFPVVLLPDGLTWWRSHENQQFSDGDASNQQYIKGFLKDIAALESEGCPLTAEERTKAIKRCRWVHCRFILRLCKSGTFGKAWAIKQASSISTLELLSAFLPKL